MPRNTAASKIANGVISLPRKLWCHCHPDHNKVSSSSNTTVVLIFPNLRLWRRSLRSNLVGIHSKKLYRATLITGCPKSSFPFFIGLYFSTIGLGKKIIWTKVVTFNLIHYFRTCCAIFWLENSICVLLRQRCACASFFFQPFFVCILSPELLELLPCFLWITRKINTLNAKTSSYVRA